MPSTAPNPPGILKSVLACLAFGAAVFAAGYYMGSELNRPQPDLEQIPTGTIPLAEHKRILAQATRLTELGFPIRTPVIIEAHPYLEGIEVPLENRVLVHSVTCHSLQYDLKVRGVRVADRGPLRYRGYEEVGGGDLEFVVVEDLSESTQVQHR